MHLSKSYLIKNRLINCLVTYLGVQHLFPVVKINGSRFIVVSSVDWVARGQRNFRFREGASGLLFGAISGQKGGCLGCFWGFSAPSGSSGCRTSSTSHGKPPNVARFEGNLGTNGTTYLAPRHLIGTSPRHLTFGTSHLAPHWHLMAPHNRSDRLTPHRYLCSHSH